MMNVLLEESFPIFDFLTGTCINFEVKLILVGSLILSSVECCNDQNCKTHGASPQTPLGGFTAPPMGLPDLHFVKL